MYTVHVKSSLADCLQDEPLSGWRLIRTIDGMDKADYTFKPDFVLRAAGKSKVGSPM